MFTTNEPPSSVTVWTPVFTAALTLFGVFVGSGFTILTEMIRNNSARVREQEARQDARRDILFQRRNEFQHSTLLELQDETYKYMRNASQHHLFDENMIRKHGKRWVEPYPDDITDECMRTNGRTAALVTRVADDRVRHLLKQMKDQAVQANLTQDRDAREVLIQAAGSTLVELNTRIGEVIRGLDKLEP